MKQLNADVRHAGDYLANLGFTELTFCRSKECVEDMIAYGAACAKTMAAFGLGVMCTKNAVKSPKKKEK